MRRLTLHIPSIGFYILTVVAGIADWYWLFVAVPATCFGVCLIGIEYEAKKQGLL